MNYLMGNTRLFPWGTLIHAEKRRFFFLNQRDQRFSASKSLTLKKSRTLGMN